MASEPIEFVKRHKVLVGVGAAGLVLLLLLRRSSSSASSGGISSNAVQLAQAQAATNLQMAQIQAQQNTAQLSATVQSNANTDALTASQNNLEAQITEAAIAAQTQQQQTSAQKAIYEDLISAGTTQQLSQDVLTAQKLKTQQQLATSIIPDLNKGGSRDAATNALALVLDQGNVASFNEATAASSQASSYAQASILSSVFKGASSVVGSLFG